MNVSGYEVVAIFLGVFPGSTTWTQNTTKGRVWLWGAVLTGFPRRLSHNQPRYRYCTSTREWTAEATDFASFLVLPTAHLEVVALIDRLVVFLPIVGRRSCMLFQTSGMVTSQAALTAVCMACS